MGNGDREGEKAARVGRPTKARRSRRVLGTAFFAGAAAAAVALATPLKTARADEPPRRDVPDYDGRGSPPTTPGDVALWVPRVIFSPVYFVTEFLIRRPLGFLIAGAERAGLPETLYNFFFFGPDHKAGFAPLAFVDFGFNPSVGIYAFWDDAFVKGNDLRFHGSIWTDDWIAGDVTDRIALGGKSSLSIDALGVRRPDKVFYGIGPRTLESAQSRFGEDLLQGSATIDVPLWRASRIKTTVGIRAVSLYAGHYGDDPSVEEAAANHAFPLPDGLGSEYTEEYNHVLAALDTRRGRPADGSGVRVELEAEQGSDVRQSPSSGWIRYGGSAGAFYDLDGLHRVVSLSVTTLFVDPLGNQPIPFTELVSLGGEGPMRGFYPGRLVDRSAAVATVRYRWPIWVWLDGSLQAAVGNVFGDHLDEFKPSLLRFSSAIGIESVGTPDNSIEFLFGIGTETFEHGGQIDSFRLALGTNRGF